jgi:alkylhydroperoxidase family enzyme
MSRISLSNVGNSPMERSMAHAPHILAPWVQLEDAFLNSPTFSTDLREQVCRTLAMAHGCLYCQAKAGPPEKSHADTKVAAAVELANIFAVDHRDIDDKILTRYKTIFSEAELAELMLYMGFMWVGGTFGAVMGLQSRETYGC